MLKSSLYICFDRSPLFVYFVIDFEVYWIIHCADRIMFLVKIRIRIFRSYWDHQRLAWLTASIEGYLLKRRVQITSPTSFIQDEAWTLTDLVFFRPDYCSVIEIQFQRQACNAFSNFSSSKYIQSKQNRGILKLSLPELGKVVYQQKSMLQL